MLNPDPDPVPLKQNVAVPVTAFHNTDLIPAFFLLFCCTVGYSDFHKLMGFTGKKMPNNILFLFIF
jgi:hypothetical protein